MAEPQTPEPLSPEEKQDLLVDPRMQNAAIRAQLAPKLGADDQAWLQQSFGAAGPQGLPALGLTAPPRVNGPDPRGPGETVMGGIMKAPGMGESLATLPLVAANFVPGLNVIDKPATIPLAGLLGGLGEASEQAVTSKPWSLNDIIGAAIRQAGLEGTGRLISAGANPIMGKWGLPGAPQGAVTAAVEEGIGRNLDKARQVSRTLNDVIERKAAVVPPIPMDEALAPQAAAVNRAINRSPLPISTNQALTAEEAAIRAENNPVLSGAEALEKKRGAGSGYEAITRKQLQGQTPSAPSLTEESLRKGLQQALEARDPSLIEDNQRLGRVTDLIKYLAPGLKDQVKGSLGELGTRAVIGGGIGGALGSNVDEKGYGAMLGSVIAASPDAGAITAKAVNALGQTLPPLVRGASVVIPSIRRRVLGPSADQEP